MRPVALRISGFACFKDEQPILELGGLSLMAIAGATGAGKSTILDAMTFALYGKVPRMGKQAVRELIALGRDRLAVVLDFEIEGQRWRVARTAHRKRSAEAQLERLEAGEGRPDAEGVRGVDARIEEIVGLGYDTFVRAVVLPQGQFDQLLRSQAGDRRRILVELLRLQVYDKMGREARRQCRELDGELKHLETRLAEDFAGVDQAGLEAATRAQEAAEAAVTQGREAAAAAEAARDEVRRLAALTAELERKQAEISALEAAAAGVAGDERRLEAARRAAEVVPLVEAVEAARSAAAEARGQATEAAERSDAAASAHEEARARLAAAEAGAGQAETWRARLQALDQIVGLLGPRKAAVEREREAEAGLRQAVRTVEDAEDALERRTSELKQRAEGLERARAEVEEVGYDADRERRLEAARIGGDHLRAARAAAQSARQEAGDATAALEGVQAEAREAEAAAEVARTRHAEREDTRVEAASAASRAEHEQRVHGLRAELAAGDDCPVCLQPVADPPAAEAGDLEAARRALEAAEEAARQSQAAYDEARRSADRLIARREDLEARATVARERVEEQESAVQRAEAALRGRIGLELDGDGLIEEELAAALISQAAQRQEHADRVGRRDEAARAHEASRHAREAAETALSTARERVAELEGRLEAARREARSLAEQIARVTTEADPAAERQRLAARLETALAERDAAANAERAAERQAHDAARDARERRRAATTAEETAATRRMEAEDRAREAGFDALDAVRAAALPAAERAALEQVIERHRTARAGATARIAELEEALEDRRITAAEAEEAEQAAREARVAHEQRVAALAQAGAKVRDLTERLAQADTLRARAGEVEAGRDVYRRLEQDLRSDQFQAYLIDEVFRALVEGASARLFQLTGRYELRVRDEAFFVVDHDNAQQQRSTDTLSGGETFLTSLALALELSEQVQRSAGALRLESIFIDEGFGTLDAETLETVAEAIEALSATGRLVGVITHVSELTSRLPSRVEVTRSPAGSTLRLVG